MDILTHFEFSLVNPETNRQTFTWTCHASRKRCGILGMESATERSGHPVDWPPYLWAVSVFSDTRGGPLA